MGDLINLTMKENYSFSYNVFEDVTELTPDDQALVEKARKATELSYAPYSKFNVAAVAKTSSGQFVTGTNQENASFPAGICAERTLLSAVSSLYPADSVTTIAISYHNNNAGGHSDRPVSPCGICRQSLLEFENRTKQKIRLILSGMNGKVMVIDSASMLLPFSFGSDDLK